MSASRFPRVRRIVRILCAGVGCLPASLALSAYFPSLSRANPETPEVTIPRLEFRIADVKPDFGPVRSLRYSCEIFSSGAKEPLIRPEIACQTKDGILRIPNPFPPFGRIRVCVNADDGEKAYRSGYGSFSYRIDAKKSTEPLTIPLELGLVLTGKVLDAETARPITGAEVAPLKWGHHSSWADWDHSATADQAGRYRIATREAQGIAARHPKYRDVELDYRPWGFKPGHNRRAADSLDNKEAEEPAVGPEGFVLRLHSLLTLRGRLVGADGKPIAGAFMGGWPVTSEPNGSDKQGRFCLKVTREEWDRREKRQIDFYAPNHRLTEVSLDKFSLDRETLVTLKPERMIHGQVLDEHGRPLEDCTIELKCDSRNSLPGMYSEVSGPYKEGRWQHAIDEEDRVFTLRVSVGGIIRSVRRYTIEEVTRGPVVTRLAKGRRLTGRLTARLPLDTRNTPIAHLASVPDEKVIQQARVGTDGIFTFSGLADGRYALRLYPRCSARYRAGQMNPGVAAFSTFWSDSPNKPWERAITIQGQDVQLGSIDLHEARLLPGRLTGVAFHPAGDHRPFANVFGYVCAAESDFDSVGGSYYLLRFMTDAEGRFRVEHCPPGKHVLRLSDEPSQYGPRDPSVWIRVTPEKTLGLRLFAPETDSCLAVRFLVGDGSARDVHAGAALDADVIAKHADKKTGELPFIKDDRVRFRAQIAEIACEIKPLEEAIDHWPIVTEQFKFSPGNLLKGDRSRLVIPNLSPGRWRLTLTAVYDSLFRCDETLPMRELVFVRGMGPLEIRMPAAALAGTIENPARGVRDRVTIEAIPRQPGLPTRTCRGQIGFRFIGLLPGEYTLRIRAEGCEEKRVPALVIRNGKTTWLDKLVLKAALPKKQGPGTAP